MRFEAPIQSFRGKKEATPTSEVGQILSRAERHAKAVGKVFGLKSNPLVLSPCEIRFFDFFVMEEVSLLFARNPEHDERLDRHLSEFDSLPKNVETHFANSYKELVRTLSLDRRLTHRQLADFAEIQKPLRQAAQLMATSFLTNTPKTIADIEQVIGECKDLADEYKNLFEEGEFPKDILWEKSLIEKAVAAEQDFSKKHPIITAGTAIAGVLAFGSSIIWELKQDVPPPPKNTPAILTSATTQDGQPTPAPLVTPEPTPAPTPEIHIPDSQFIAVAEKALSQSSVGKLSLREQIKKSGGGFAVGRLEEKSSIARAGKDGLHIRVIPIASLMVPRPNDTIRSGDEVRGIAEVKTTNPDGSTDVFWLLKPPDDHKNALQLYLPEYVRIARVFPDGSEEWYVNNVQFTKPAK